MTDRPNKVTIGDIASAIKDVTYTVLPNDRTTICQLTLNNGFTVEGSSACVSIENFDAALGRQLAHEDAVNNCWKLFGFMLAEDIHRDAQLQAKGPLERAKNELLDLSEKIVALHNFIYNDNPIYASRSDEEKERLQSQLKYMCGYREILSERIDTWQP